jgi:ABC-type transport system substrate-binding protein
MKNPGQIASVFGWTVFLTIAALLLTSCQLPQLDRLISVSPSPRSDETAKVRINSVPEDYPVRYYHGDLNVSLEPPVGWQVDEMDGDPELTQIMDPDGQTIITILREESDDGKEVQEIQQVFLDRWPGEAGGTVAGQDEFKTNSGIEGWMSFGWIEEPLTIGAEKDYWVLITLDDGMNVVHFTLVTPNADYPFAKEIFFDVAASFQWEPSQPRKVTRRTALYLASGEPTTLDPALTHYGADGIIGDIYSGLVALDPHLQVRPSLAERWEVADGGTRYIFHLNPEAKFHNGRPVTAADVQFSWERAADPKTGSETVLLYMGEIVGLEAYHLDQADQISGVKVLDDHTIEVLIREPVPYFLAKLTYPVGWVVDRYTVVLPNWTDHPNGTGPFRHIQHLKDEIFILESNPYYYGELPRINHVVYLMYAGYTQRLYETDDVDFAPISRDQLERSANPRDRLFGSVYSETGLCTFYVTFNATLPPFDDPNVRRAFVQAIDLERYVDAITEGRSPVGRGVLPPGMPGYQDDVVLPMYNPERARSLLAESLYYDGSQDPPAIIWTLPTSGGYYSPGAAFLVDAWEETLGVEVTVEGIDWDSYTEKIDAGEYGHLLKEGWCADYPDPENFLDVLFHSDSPQNHAYYNNPEFDRLIETARSEADLDQRLLLYQEAERLVVGDAAILILNHKAPSYAVWKPYVHGYVPSPIGVPQHATMWIER